MSSIFQNAMRHVTESFKLTPAEINNGRWLQDCASLRALHDPTSRPILRRGISDRYQELAQLASLQAASFSI